MPKLRNYNKVKDSFDIPAYVSSYLDRPLRSYVARIRCGVLPLKIETGRYRNIPVDDRLCQSCDLNMVEDEIHFLLKCPYYVNERKMLVQYLNHQNWTELEDVTKLKILCTNYFKYLAVYIQQCLMKRKK